jgi:hypothetical protein
LKERLEDDLRAACSLGRNQVACGSRSPWQRLKLPALALAFLGILAASSYPIPWVASNALARENKALTGKLAGIEKVRQQNDQYQKLKRVGNRLEMLKSQVEEIAALKTQIKAYQSQLDELEEIESENNAILAELERFEIYEEELAANDAGFQRIKCVSNLKYVGLSARVWAQDNDDFYPENFMVMSNELSKTKLLVCPSDISKVSAGSWPALSGSNVSYQMMSQGGKQGLDPQIIFVSCPIHGHATLSDGSVQHGLLLPENMQSKGLTTFRDQNGFLKIKRREPQGIDR